MIFSRRSEIMKLLREIVCTAEIFIFPLQKIPYPLKFFPVNYVKPINSLKVEGWICISEIWILYLLKKQNKRARRWLLSLRALLIFQGVDLLPNFRRSGISHKFSRGLDVPPPHKPPLGGPWTIFDQSLPTEHFRRTDSSY